MRTRISAVAGFNPDNGHDNLRIDAIGLFSLFEYCRILVPEGHPTLDPALGQENFAVIKPLQTLLGRFAHQRQDVVAAVCLAEDFLQFLLAESVTGDHFVDEHLYMRIGRITSGLRRSHRCRAGGKRAEHGNDGDDVFQNPFQHMDAFHSFCDRADSTTSCRQQLAMGLYRHQHAKTGHQRNNGCAAVADHRQRHADYG